MQLDEMNIKSDDSELQSMIKEMGDLEMQELVKGYLFSFSPSDMELLIKKMGDEGTKM